LAKSFAIPLVLDLRDAWSLDPYVEGSRLKKVVYRYIYPTLERTAFNGANTILVNTQSALVEYRKIYPRLAGRFVLLPNGYDEADFADIKIEQSPHETPLTVIHIGRFGIGNRNPRLIFKALQMLKDDGVQLVFKMIGDPVGDLDLKAAAERLSGMVQVIPTVPHAEALVELCKSDVAMLYQEDSSSNVTAVAGKTYEYIRSGKPILAIAPAGDNLELVRQMAGFCRIIQQPTDEYTIASELRRLVELKALNQLPAFCSAKDEYTQKFSRRAVTAALVEQFELTLRSFRAHAD
jgi:glycosyltransferase involved in cell wall biosynthesis